MQTYEVDDDLAVLIERTAKAKPFETLSFNDALWRVVRNYVLADKATHRPGEGIAKGEPAAKSITAHAEQPVDRAERKPLFIVTRDPDQEDFSETQKARMTTVVDLDRLLAEARSSRTVKAASPSARLWAASIPALRDRKGLSDWRGICDYLGIDTAGDSARRSLQRWVRANRPQWQPVPDPREQ